MLTVDTEDLEDIRLAVVLNGGVSLAVWIGGVAREINRLSLARRSGNDFYRSLLGVIGSKVRVDVIAGTSAGGINGPALALAEVFGTDLAPLGTLWITAGGFADLLRDPLEKNPRSLLQGDSYLLPQLVKAFHAIRPEAGTPETHRPMDLTVTGALWHGERVPFFDDYGSRIVETVHQMAFRFRRRDPDPVWAPEADIALVLDPVDSFANPSIVEQLALAARSTSANPFGFEASWVPVDAEGQDDTHPSMAGIAQVLGGMPLDTGRYVLDGGILINAPVRPALASIAAYPAERQVRRLLVYIQPDPGNTATRNNPDTKGEPPTLAGVFVASGIDLPKAQTVAGDLADLRLHNAQARQARAERADRFHAWDTVETPALCLLAATLLPAYRRMRARQVADQVAELWCQQAPPMVPAAGPVSGLAAVPLAWAPDELAAAFGLDTGGDDSGDWDFYPDTLVVPVPPDSEGAAPLTLDSDLNRWGLEPVGLLASIAQDLSRRALWLAPLDDFGLRERIRAFREAVHRCRGELATLDAANVAYWRDALTRLPSRPSTATQRRAALATWAAPAAPPWIVHANPVVRLSSGAIGQKLIQLTRDHRADLEQAATAQVEHPWTVPGAEQEAKALLRLIDGFLAQFEPMERYLALQVCRTVLGSAAPDPGLETALMQVSAYTPNALGISATPAKLTGIQLSHFGAFYKQAWRANDWIWGRLDGAFRMVQATLDPARLRQLGYGTEELMKNLRQVAIGSAIAGDQRYLADEWDASGDTVERELRFLDHPGDDPPDRLVATATAVARRVQLEILRDELPGLALAAHADLIAGSKKDDKAAQFFSMYDLATRGGPPDAQGIVTLWKDAGIGQETFASEYPSDLLTTTVSTVAAVAVNAFESTHSGLKPFRVVAKALRGVTLVLYVLARSSVGGGVGVAVTSFILALGGALLGVTLMVPNAPPVFALVGTAIILAGLALAALRAGIKVFVAIFAVLLLAVAAVLVTSHVEHWVQTNGSTWRMLAAIAAVAALAVGLGSVHGSSKKQARKPAKESSANSEKGRQP